MDEHKVYHSLCSCRTISACVFLTSGLYSMVQRALCRDKASPLYGEIWNDRMALGSQANRLSQRFSARAKLIGRFMLEKS